MKTTAYVILSLVLFLSLVEGIPDDGQVFTRHHRTLLILGLINLTGLLVLAAAS